MSNPNATGKTAKPISYDPAAKTPPQRDMDWTPVDKNFREPLTKGPTKTHK